MIIMIVQTLILWVLKTQTDESNEANPDSFSIGVSQNSQLKKGKVKIDDSIELNFLAIVYL